MNIYEKLCSHDPKNPNCCDEEPCEPGNRCYCDNCFYGRHELAFEIIQLHDNKQQLEANHILGVALMEKAKEYIAELEEKLADAISARPQLRTLMNNQVMDELNCYREALVKLRCLFLTETQQRIVDEALKGKE